jgi:hypothetical protein
VEHAAAAPARITRRSVFVINRACHPRWSNFGRLNAIGAEGWELVSQEEITLKGGLTGSVKGTATICFFKRPVAEDYLAVFVPFPRSP